jgi:hypothetical protein
MTSTDIDGSPIVILSEDDATAIYRLMQSLNEGCGGGYLLPEEIVAGNKIAKSLGFRPVDVLDEYT